MMDYKLKSNNEIENLSSNSITKFKFNNTFNNSHQKNNSISNNSFQKNILKTKFGDINSNIIKKNKKEIIFNFNENSDKVNLNFEFPEPENLPESKDEIIKLLDKLDKRIHDLESNNTKQDNIKLKEKINKTELKINEFNENKKLLIDKIQVIKENMKKYKNEIELIKSKYQSNEYFELSEKDLEKKKLLLEKELKTLKIENQKKIFEKKLELENNFRKKLEKNLFEKILEIAKNSTNQEIQMKYKKLLKIKNKL